VAQTSRVALDRLEIGGKQAQVGEVITVSLLAAGHDPLRHSERLPRGGTSSGILSVASGCSWLQSRLSSAVLMPQPAAP
jgi:hypothetical protein